MIKRHDRSIRYSVRCRFYRASSIVVFALCWAIVSVAHAGWNCSCGRYVTTSFCTYCGAKEPLNRQKTDYPPRRATVPEPEWYNGKLVKRTPIKIGFLGPELALPIGEYYSVFGLYTDPLVASVVNVYGVEIGGCAAGATKNMYGLVIGGLISEVRTLRGLQMGGLGTASSDFEGVQIGCFNNVRNGVGVQIGVVNLAETFTGVQIGAINYIKYSSVPFLPVINAYF